MLVNSAVSPSQNFTEPNIKYLVLITFLNYITYLLITLISPYCFLVILLKILSNAANFNGKGARVT